LNIQMSIESQGIEKTLCPFSWAIYGTGRGPSRVRDALHGEQVARSACHLLAKAHVQRAGESLVIIARSFSLTWSMSRSRVEVLDHSK